MQFTQTIKLGLAVAGLCALGAAAPSANAQAQLQYYTLSGVTFADGATASGSFVFDPTSIGPVAPISSFDITTTNGITDSFAGVHYLSPGNANLVEDGRFVFNIPAGELFLAPGPDPTFNPAGTNVIPLVPEFKDPNFGTLGSYESVYPNSRQIVSGFLIESPAAVPEASTTVSFGLLLTLGLGGAVIMAERKKRRFKSHCPAYLTARVI